MAIFWTVEDALLGEQLSAFGDGNFLTFSDGAGAISSDGAAWSGVVFPSGNWKAGAYGVGKFLVVGDNGISETSIDGGTTWVTQSGLPIEDYLSVSGGPGLFVAVGDTGSANERAQQSSDGENWVTSGHAVTNFSLAKYVNGRHVVAAHLGGNIQVYNTVDGSSWSALSTTALIGAIPRGIAFGGGLYVMLMDNGQTLTSTDLMTWAVGSVGVAGVWRDIEHDGSQFVAISSGGSAKARSSADGLSWADDSPAPSQDWRSLISAGTSLFLFSSTTISSSGAFIPPLCTILGDAARYRSEGETTTGTRLLTDDEYRLFIKARIAKNQSKGTINSLVDLISFLIGSTGFTVLDGNAPARFSVAFDVGTLTANEKVFIGQSDLIPKPAGVGLTLFEYPANGAFAYAGAPGDVAGYDVGQYIDTF